MALSVLEGEPAALFEALSDDAVVNAVPDARIDLIRPRKSKD